jgi:hypothetical protein
MWRPNGVTRRVKGMWAINRQERETFGLEWYSHEAETAARQKIQKKKINK